MYRASPASYAARRMELRRLRKPRRIHVHVGRVIVLLAVSLTVALQVVSAGQDGGTATGATPTVTFATAGSHTVTLTANDGNGGTDTDTVVNTVAAGATPAPALPDTLTSPPDTSDPAHAVVIGALVLAAAISLAIELRRRVPPRAARDRVRRPT